MQRRRGVHSMYTKSSKMQFSHSNYSGAFRSAGSRRNLSRSIGFVLQLILHRKSAQTDSPNPISWSSISGGGPARISSGCLGFWRHFGAKLSGWGTGPDLLRVPRILASFWCKILQLCLNAKIAQLAKTKNCPRQLLHQVKQSNV